MAGLSYGKQFGLRRSLRFRNLVKSSQAKTAHQAGVRLKNGYSRHAHGRE
jgi:hypothetical protein